MDIRVTFCSVVLNRLYELGPLIRKVSPYVDRTIIIDGGSEDGTIKFLESQECRDLNVESRVIKQERFQYGNHTPDARNPYLELAGDGGWILVLDSDEFLEEAACRSLRTIAGAAEDNSFNVVGFRAHDHWTYEDGRVHDNLSSYWHHSMFFKAAPGMHYAGHTHAGLVRPDVSYRRQDLDYEYLHIKTERRMWQGSTYLWWTTSDTAQNTTSLVWEEFHDLMGRYRYYDWHEFNKVMSAGEVPEEVGQWFIQHRNAENPEERSWFVWYYIFLQSSQNYNRISNRDLPWDYVEQARMVREGKLDKWTR